MVKKYKVITLCGVKQDLKIINYQKGVKCMNEEKSFSNSCINWFPRPVVKITSKMKYIKGEFYG